VALPFDFINAFRTRPKPIKLKEYAEEKAQVAKRAQEIQIHGKDLRDVELQHMKKKPKRKERNRHKKNLAQFENNVYMLKNDLEYLETAFKLKGGNPFIPFGKLVLGILGIIISLMWFLQICLFILPEEPVHPFLNNLFVELSFPGFELMGVVAFCFQSFWLFLAVVKGAFRFGIQIPYVIKIYPMELGKTLMNAFLVNTWILLICALPTVHFCSIAFPVYARNTAVDLLFGSQIKYVKFFGAFFQNNIFIYVLLVFSFLTLIYVSLCARSIRDEVDKQLEELKEAKQTSN